MSEKRSWFASGKERTPGNLLKYTFIVLTGVVFAAVSLVLLLSSRGTVGSSLLWGAIAAVITAVIGVIVFLVYTKLLAKK
jgi:hypothetical protein